MGERFESKSKKASAKRRANAAAISLQKDMSKADVQQKRAARNTLRAKKSLAKSKAVLDSKEQKLAKNEGALTADGRKLSNEKETAGKESKAKRIYSKQRESEKKLQKKVKTAGVKIKHAIEYAN